jgi:predicted RNA-binding protein YlxR (DUF448 family)
MSRKMTELKQGAMKQKRKSLKDPIAVAAGSMAVARKHPLRTCVGCLAKSPKASLVRLVLDEQEHVVWDYLNERPGRGAYVCPSKECLDKALKKNRFNRAFRRPVSVDIISTAALPWMRENT